MEAAKKGLFFSGPATKALPPPLELIDQNIFLEKNTFSFRRPQQHIGCGWGGWVGACPIAPWDPMRSPFTG